MAQKFAQKFYKSKAWQETRDAYAASVGWLCERCFAVGMYTPGEIVHHKVYLTAQNIGDPAVSLAWDNLELLCRDCHANMHKKQSPRRYIIADDGCVMVTAPPIRRRAGRLADRKQDFQISLHAHVTPYPKHKRRNEVWQKE